VGRADEQPRRRGIVAAALAPFIDVQPGPFHAARRAPTQRNRIPEETETECRLGLGSPDGA